MRTVLKFSLTCLMALGLTACSDDDPTIGGPIEGDDFQYIFDSLTAPTTPEQADQLGLNIDGDDLGRPDNALGGILAALSGFFEVQPALDEQIDQGGLLLLANLRASDIANATNAGTWIFLGANPGTEPCVDENDMTCRQHLNGNTTFELDPASPNDALLAGNVVNSRFTGGPANVAIELALFEGDPLNFNLVGTRLEINEISDSTLTNAKLGGAITQDELDTELKPAIVVLLNNILTDPDAMCVSDAGSCDCADDTADTVASFADLDGSCSIDLEELNNNNILSSVLQPDLDLFDAAGEFNPNVDGIDDSLSLGLGFTAVGASFDAGIASE